MKLIDEYYYKSFTRNLPKLLQYFEFKSVLAVQLEAKVKRSKKAHFVGYFVLFPS